LRHRILGAWDVLRGGAIATYWHELDVNPLDEMIADMDMQNRWPNP
jgi:hypothetical protein